MNIQTIESTFYNFGRHKLNFLPTDASLPLGKFNSHRNKCVFNLRYFYKKVCEIRYIYFY